MVDTDHAACESEADSGYRCTRDIGTCSILQICCKPKQSRSWYVFDELKVST